MLILPRPSRIFSNNCLCPVPYLSLIFQVNLDRLSLKIGIEVHRVNDINMDKLGNRVRLDI